VNPGSSLGYLPPAPAKYGCAFGGWYTGWNGGDKPFTASAPVTADITVYAKWTINTYTVTFHVTEEDPDPQTRMVPHGGKIDLSPEEPPTKAGHTFGGWNTAVDGGGTQFNPDTPVTNNMTFYARWLVPDFPSLQGFFEWLELYAEDGGNYTCTLHDDETIASKMFVYGGKKVSITLEGDSQERKVNFSNTSGDFFAVEKDVTLTLGNNFTLQGRDNSPKSLIVVCRGGNLVMNAGSKICGNKLSSGNGGGMYLAGTFTMNGGEISGNSATNLGGGVVMTGEATFTMNGGIITGNTAQSGGGVFVNGGMFNWNGGEISGNTLNDVAP
jgi:uncharacterized repeat protein (TIGR02543 family)